MRVGASCRRELHLTILSVTLCTITHTQKERGRGRKEGIERDREGQRDRESTYTIFWLRNKQLDKEDKTSLWIHSLQLFYLTGII